MFDRLDQRFSSSQRCSPRLRSGLCAVKSSSSSPDSLILVFQFVHFLPFTAPNGPSSTPEKHHKSLLHQTLHSAQCSQASTVVLASTNPRLVHQIARWRSVIGRFREQVFTALESSGCVFTPLYMTPCIVLGDVRLVCSRSPWKPAPPTHLCMHCSWLCRKSVTFVRLSIRWPRSAFMWPTTSRLSCCCSHSLSHCYSAANTWLRNILYIISPI